MKNIFDKVVGLIDPQKGLDRLKARSKLKVAEKVYSEKSRIPVKNAWEKGYSNKDDITLNSWYTQANSPDEDINESLEDLRGKSRSLYMNNTIAGAALKKYKTRVVGQGLIPKPMINYQHIGTSREEAKKIEKIIKSKFDSWANSNNSDASRMLSFYEQQALVVLSWVMNGDAFAIPLRKKREGVSIDLCIQLLEADRIASPLYTDDNLIQAGVEYDKNGQLLAYHILSHYPNDANPYQTKRYPAFNSLGKRNIYQVFESERIGQRRGVPILAPIIFALKQLGTYKDAEISAAVVNAMVAMIIESQSKDTIGFGGGFGSGDDTLEDGNGPRERSIGIEHSQLIVAGEGETIREYNTQRPNKQYEAFTSALYTEIGADLEIPKDSLLSDHKSSYSAAKASMEEAEKRFEVSRKILERRFCQPIYEEFILELIKNGDINCPGFFEDDSIRRAFCKCVWVGAGKVSLDPLKEANAVGKRLKNFTTTREIEAAQHGLDFDEIVEARKEEEMELAEIQRMVEEVNKNAEENNGEILPDEQAGQ